jgi:hypothetical protein
MNRLSPTLTTFLVGLISSQGHSAAGTLVSPQFVQQNYAAPQQPQSKVAVAYTQPQTAGDANILAIGWNDTFAAISSVTDSAGNVYQPAVPAFQANGMSQALYYAANIHPGGNTVTVTFNQPAAFIDLRIAEYSGLSTANPFDGGTSGAGSGSNADSGPVSVSITNDLIFGAGMTATAFTSPGAGFSLRIITVPNGDIVEDEVAAGSGLYRASATLTSGAWLMQVAAFKAAAPAGPPRLSIFLTATNTTLILWPSTPAGFALQANSQLGTLDWASVTNSVGVIGGQNYVVVPLSNRQEFYRLKSQ